SPRGFEPAVRRRRHERLWPLPRSDRLRDVLPHEERAGASAVVGAAAAHAAAQRGKIALDRSADVTDGASGQLVVALAEPLQAHWNADAFFRGLEDDVGRRRPG